MTDKLLIFLINFMLTAILFTLPYSQNTFAISNTKDVEEFGIDEKLGEKLALDTEFFDTEGNKANIKSYFPDNKPVLINLAYFNCPRVCTYVIDGVVEAINELNTFKLGKDYRVLTISFNEKETPEISKLKSRKYINNLKNKNSVTGNWVFLTGDKENIDNLTNSLGYRFKRDGEEFAHPSALVVATPNGKISRYLYGVQHDTKDIKLSLIEASEGKIGESELLNKVLLFCYQFDPLGKKYALRALNVVKAGGVVTLLALTGFLTFLWKREKKSNNTPTEV